MPAAGKRRVQAVAGTVNMQQVVRELSDLKRDLRDWRSRTNKSIDSMQAQVNVDHLHCPRHVAKIPLCSNI